jgi:NDP-sugar pyrophosphorylase family protein
MNILLLMAGDSSLFEEAGYSYPKNLIEINGMPLVQHVLESLSALKKLSENLICLVPREENRRYHTGAVINLLMPGVTVMEVDEPTAGAACTALLAIEHIDKDESLVIVNGDQLIQADLVKILDEFREQHLDGGLVVFESVHPRWSYVRCNEVGLVVEVAEKRPISNLANAGFQYFAKGRDFVSAAKSLIIKDTQLEGNFYVCPTYNEMLLNQARIGIHEIPRQKYFSLANPQNIRKYEESFYLNPQELQYA